MNRLELSAITTLVNARMAEVRPPGSANSAQAKQHAACYDAAMRAIDDASKLIDMSTATVPVVVALMVNPENAMEPLDQAYELSSRMARKIQKSMEGKK